MSIVLLIDGYNVIGPVAPPARGATADWLHVLRLRLLDQLAEHLDEPVRVRTLVVFDAKSPPADRPSRFQYQGIDVWFAVDYREADDLLEEIIAAHTAAKTLTVVSSDHRIAVAARRRRASCFDADPWLDQLLNGQLQLVHHPKHPKSKKLASDSPASPDSTAPPGPPSIPAAGDIAIDISDDMLDEMLRDYLS